MTLPLTIGILSWKSQTTLENTLQSYQDAGLLGLASEVFVFFQEISESDQALANKFGIKSFGSDKNLGIAGGYREMLNHVGQPTYLFLENDWVIPKDHYPLVIEQLSYGQKMLTNQTVDVVRYRSRNNPGSPLWTAQFRGKELSRPEHLLDCVHWESRPDLVFREYIQSLCPDWYTTSAQFANWTNNPHMIRTKWVQEILLPHLGNRDIERDLQLWWQTTSNIVLHGNGLFTHKRL